MSQLPRFSALRFVPSQPERPGSAECEIRKVLQLLILDQRKRWDFLDQGFQSHGGLEHREPIAETEVDAPAESDVVAGIGPAKVEFLRILEERLIMMRGAERDEDLGARGNLDSTELRIPSIRGI